jgi:hypothetical protein
VLSAGERRQRFGPRSAQVTAAIRVASRAISDATGAPDALGLQAARLLRVKGRDELYVRPAIARQHAAARARLLLRARRKGTVRV